MPKNHRPMPMRRRHGPKKLWYAANRLRSVPTGRRQGAMGKKCLGEDGRSMPTGCRHREKGRLSVAEGVSEAGNQRPCVGEGGTMWRTMESVQEQGDERPRWVWAERRQVAEEPWCPDPAFQEEEKPHEAEDGAWCQRALDHDGVRLWYGLNRVGPA